MAEMQAEQTKSSREEVRDLLQAELERVNAELRDITNKLDQSRGQVEQFAQRNATVIGEIRRIEGALEQTPRVNIKETYAEALDVQQRLLTIRGQMEKLQAQEAVAQQELDMLKVTLAALDRGDKGNGKAGPGSLSARETIMRIIDAQEEERERLARQMHDGPAHSLTNFILQAEICQKLFDRDPSKARAELSNLMTAARDAFQRVRDFIFDLRPMMLTDLGIVPTVKRYLDAYENKTGIQTEFIMMGRERRLEGYLEALVFRGIQELLVNARDHGEADSVKITVEMGEDLVRVMVEDNGRGFATGKLKLEESKEGHNLGLRTLQERVKLVGGEIHIDSVSGQGAIVEISVPIVSELTEPEDFGNLD